MIHSKVSDLTIDEFRALIRQTVREVLTEMASDPDEGLELQEEIEQVLNRSMKSVRDGGVTYSAEDVAKRLGLEW
jgi:hypothetical protein